MTVAEELRPHAEPSQRGSRDRWQGLACPWEASAPPVDDTHAPPTPREHQRRGRTRWSGADDQDIEWTGRHGSTRGSEAETRYSVGSRSVSTKIVPPGVARARTIPKRCQPSIMSRSLASWTPVMPRSQSLKTDGL